MIANPPATPPLNHLAIIMDGNGRWARARGLPRSAGHQMGRKALKALVKNCANRHIPILTVFAFSSENWSRPATEVRYLLQLLTRALEREVPELHQNGIRLRFIGDVQRFSPALRNAMANAEKLTAKNTAMDLNIAVNYGGHWDITQAVNQLLATHPGQPISEEMLSRHLCLSDIPPPDLLIRTGGEQRISNFMLWQLAYTELYFSPVLWPDFKNAELTLALEEFALRERRFGGVNAEPAKQQAHA